MNASIAETTGRNGAQTLVVGAGVLGTAIADELAGAGRKDIVLLDVAEPGHATSASGDTTRILRSGYGGATDYTRRARAALADWRALAERTGESLLVDTGALWLATGNGVFEETTLRELEANDIPVERLDPDQIAQMYPSIDVDDVLFGVYEPEGKVLRARACVAALAASAAARGVDVIRGEGGPDGDRVLVNGRPFEADEVVWATGAWLPGQFPGVIDCTVTRQDAVFVQADGDDWSLEAIPAWIDPSGQRYGIGAENGRLKIASSAPGPEFDPWTTRPDATVEEIESARHYADRRFPALAPSHLAGVRACQYSSTADTQFILAPHPDRPGWWFAGGDSGHAFKHALWIARHVRDLLQGENPDPAFGLGARDGARGLRVSSN